MSVTIKGRCREVSKKYFSLEPAAHPDYEAFMPWPRTNGPAFQVQMLNSKCEATVPAKLFEFDYVVMPYYSCRDCRLLSLSDGG